jgi:hypothetical protein
MCFRPNLSRTTPGRQINPSYSKENQGKRLGFPWIPLAESGLINGLQRIQMKKIFSPVTRRLSRRKRLFSSPLRMDWREIDPAIGKKLAHDFCFFNKNTEGSDLQAD